MASEDKPLWKRLPAMLAVAGVLVVVLLVMGRALSNGLSPAAVLGYVLVAVAGYVVFLVGMPLFFWIVGEAGYRTFLKPYVRVWRIQRIRNKRLWDEVASRDSSDSP